MTLTAQAEKAKAKTTAELQAAVKTNGPHFERDQWWRTEGDHTVKLTYVGLFFMDGTIWKKWDGRQVCFGQYSWMPSGRYFDSTTSIHDLKEQITAPHWVEELGAAA